MAQSRSFFDDVRKELECSVCQEQFSEVNEPKILKCLHTFCKTCLEAWLRQQREGRLSCPTCRQITECPNNNITSLPSNLFYKQMVEIVEAYSDEGQEHSAPCGNCEENKSLQFYCSDCNCFLCADCAAAHKKMKVLSDHHVKKIANFEPSDMQDYARKTNLCKKHKDELRFYCHKCNICICRDCAVLEHREHDFVSFDQALESKKSEIGKKMQNVAANCSRLRKRKECLEKRKERVNNSINQAANEVHQVAKRCINLIRQHEDTMTEKLLKQEVNLQDSFSAQMTALDEKLVEIDSSLEFGRDVIERNNLPEILNVEEILEQRFMELSSLPDEFCVKLNCSEVKYVPSDTSSLKTALGKFSFTNTEPSLSIVQGKGLTEGLLGEDSTFTIITKDSQGQTTYSQIDKVNVDIQSLQTGRITKPSITDTKDGCYKVTYKPEDEGELSVSITVSGEAIMGSPFQLRVKETGKTMKKKRGRQRQSKEAALPDYWVSQPTDPTTEREDAKPYIFLLDPISDRWEYGKVADKFRQSCTYSIIKIYRFQHSEQYRKYASRKEIMDKESDQGSNEMWLFYGADVWAFDQTVSGGLSKITGDYGKGLYFAVQASYSVQFSPPDTNGNRYVYLEKVLVGEYAVGSPDLLQPPPKNVNNPQKRYDSVVDDVNNPSIFVVFNADQCCPDYLITFK